MYLLAREAQVSLQFCFCHTLPINAFIVLFTLVWDFFDQVSRGNSKHFGELAQGDGGGRPDSVYCSESALEATPAL